MELIHLRPYQQQIIDKAITLLENDLKTLIVSPTGSGKSILFLYLIGILKPKTVLIVVPSLALKEQTQELIDTYQLEMTCVETVQTITSSSVSGNVDLLICDEAHRYPNQKIWHTLFKLISSNHTAGFTATPYRMDNAPLLVENGGVFDRIILGPDIEILVQQGYAAHLEYYTVPLSQKVKLVPLYTKYGTLLGKYQEVEVQPINMVGSMPQILKEYCRSYQTLIFCKNVAHAIDQAEQLWSLGFTCKALYSKLDTLTKKDIMTKFKNGEVQYLTLCNMLSEGVNIPQIKNAILARNIQSLGLFVQDIGRIMRPYNNETGNVIDLVGNLYNHGTVEQVDSIVRANLGGNVNVL